MSQKACEQLLRGRVWSARRAQRVEWALLATRHGEWLAAQCILVRDARATRVRPQGALHNCRAGAPRGALCVGVVLWASGAERGCCTPPQARFLKHGHPKFQVLEK